MARRRKAAPADVPVVLLPDVSDPVEHCYDVWEVRVIEGVAERTRAWHGHDYEAACGELDRRACEALTEVNAISSLELTECVTRLRRVAVRIEGAPTKTVTSERNYG